LQLHQTVDGLERDAASRWWINYPRDSYERF